DGKVDGFIERDDLMSSVAFWYQMEPHQPWPALPAGPDRLPFHDRVLLKGHDAVAGAQHSDAPIQTQSVGGTTDNQQLWLRPQGDKAWVEVSFQLDHPETGEVTCKMVHSFDYGNYDVKLDGKQMGKLNL